MHLDDMPIAVIDFETTGLNPGGDRVLEVSVARIEPGRAPELVFDSIIHPERPVAASFIHGITDSHIIGAPTFAEAAGDLVRAVSGCVLAAYNASFDMKFLTYELGRLRLLREPPPHLCVMYLRPLLGLGPRCRLAEACRLHRVPLVDAHASGADTLATAQIMVHCLEQMRGSGLRSFTDLRTLGRNHRYLASLDRQPLDANLVRHRPPCRTKPRTHPAPRPHPAA